MHVLIAAHDLHPDPGSGGTGRYVYETARRLAGRGHRVSVITRRRGDVPHRERLAGIDVFRYDVTIAGNTIGEILPQLPTALRSVSRFYDRACARRRPDLLSFQGPVTAFLLDLVAGEDVPRSATFHSPWPTEYAIKTRDGGRPSPRRWANVAARKRIEGRVLAATDGAITLSEFMRTRLRRVHGSAHDAAVVPGGVDTERFAPDAGAYAPIAGSGNDEGAGSGGDSEGGRSNGGGRSDGGGRNDGAGGSGPSFLTVRRLSRRMGHDLLLDAFAAVARRRPDAELYIAGDGPLRDPLERRAASLGIADRTTFLGYVPEDDLPAAYATADVFVLPTAKLEGFGLATLEALAAGTPVVATPVGGTAEVLGPLDEDDDLPAPALVSSPAAEPLAERMAAWAALGDGERRAAGRACQEYALERYTWEESVSKLESRYQALTDVRGNRRG